MLDLRNLRNFSTKHQIVLYTFCVDVPVNKQLLKTNRPKSFQQLLTKNKSKEKSKCFFDQKIGTFQRVEILLLHILRIQIKQIYEIVLIQK